MDLVHKRIPKWAWGGINRCRLYLQATMIADIATIDGTYVPLQIREVQDELRENRLLFPCQQKPSKADISQWKYFIDSISENGHLHVLLGQWTRRPDQVFSFMVNDSKDIIYKYTNQWWQVFRRNKATNRRFLKVKIQVGSIPDTCRPVKVIDTSSYVLLLNEQNLDEINNSTRVEVNTFSTQRHAQVTGEYTVDAGLLDGLQTNGMTQSLHWCVQRMAA